MKGGMEATIGGDENEDKKSIFKLLLLLSLNDHKFIAVKNNAVSQCRPTPIPLFTAKSIQNQ